MNRAITELDSLPVEVDDATRSQTRVRAAPRVAVKSAAPRWLALDLFRFAAVCLMVQGHVFSTLLDEATKATGWYPHHAFVHGYTAPMFLFGAGLAFGYTTFRGWDEHARGGPAAIKRFQRYGWLLAIGYGLHLPTLSLARLFAIDDPARIARMLQVDVLQHIGVSLALAQALVWIVKDRRVFIGAIAALALFVVAAAPWIWNLDLGEGSGVPIALAGYVNASTGSYFPIVPWAGFTYAGILIAYFVGVGRGESVADVARRAAWPFTALALAFMLVPVVIDRFGPFPWPPHNFWKTSPFFFFWRLGNVLAVLAVLCFAERAMSRFGWLGSPKGAAEAPSPMGRLAQRMVPWVKLIAAESLIVYVGHLLVLHGSVIAPGIKHGEVIHERSHGLLGATLVTIALFAAMVLLAKTWSELKKQRLAFRVVQITMLAILAFIALTS